MASHAMSLAAMARAEKLHPANVVAIIYCRAIARGAVARRRRRAYKKYPLGVVEGPALIF